MLEEIETKRLVIYIGNIKAIKDKVGKLWFYLDGKTNYVKWVFKAIEGMEREPYFVHPINISFLTDAEVARMGSRISSTNIRTENKQKVEQHARMQRHNDILD